MAAFYLDEDTPEVLAVPLERLGHIVTTTTQANRKGTKDYEQLWFAATPGLIFLTLNRADYTLLHGAWQHWNVARSHAGIIVLHHLTKEDLMPIAEETSNLVRHPREFLAMQALIDRPTFVADAVTDHLFRRWRSGKWDCLG